MSLASRSIPATFVVLWASGFIGARYAMPWSEPFTFLSARFILAAAILLLLALRLAGPLPTRRQALHCMVAGVLMHGGYLGGVFWAIRAGMPAGISALIVGLQPLITAILAGRLLGEQVMPRHWAWLGTGFVGVVVVLWPKLGIAADAIAPAALAAAVWAVVAMSLGTVWQKRFVSRVDMYWGAISQYIGGAVPMILGSLLFETRTMVWTGELIFALAWLVLVLSIGAIFLLMVMIRDGDMAKVASLFYLVPAVTAVMAYFLFGEELSPVQIAGMAIAAVGVGLATAQPPTRARASR
ncbi:MAG: EamA family transporter [Rhizobiales bacterium]|nr:EamA family transporter [Hyphomicrobiales bacterium]